MLRKKEEAERKALVAKGAFPTSPYTLGLILHSCQGRTYGWNRYQEVSSSTNLASWSGWVCWFQDFMVLGLQGNEDFHGCRARAGPTSLSWRESSLTSIRSKGK